MKFILSLGVFLCLLSCSETIQPASNPGNEPTTRSMHDAKMDSSLLRSMDENILNQTYPNIHSVLIWKNNALVFEKYYSGKDEIWGDDIGTIVFHPDTLHDIRSVTKSIVSACIGVALSQKRINSVDQRVFDFYPEFKHLDTGLSSTLTIRHLLTMTTGQTWNEDIPYTDTTNSEIRMVSSPDPVAYALSQPIEKTPGSEWKYNGGSTQVLASIIEKATGKRVDEYADEFLFKPLGIKRFTWTMYPGTMLPAAASGLRLTSRDLMKFGLLYLNDGVFNGRKIFPAEWATESIRMQIPLSPQNNIKDGYGYQFWLRTAPPHRDSSLVAIAIGNGNQRVFIDKANNMVVVVMAGNYNNWTLENNSDKLVYTFIYPAIQ